MNGGEKLRLAGGDEALVLRAHILAGAFPRTSTHALALIIVYKAARATGKSRLCLLSRANISNCANSKRECNVLSVIGFAHSAADLNGCLMLRAGGIFFRLGVSAQII